MLPKVYSLGTALGVLVLCALGGYVAAGPGGSQYCCWFYYNSAESDPQGCESQGDPWHRSGPWYGSPPHCEPEVIIFLPWCTKVFTIANIGGCEEP